MFHLLYVLVFGLRLGQRLPILGGLSFFSWLCYLSGSSNFSQRFDMARAPALRKLGHFSYICVWSTRPCKIFCPFWVCLARTLAHLGGAFFIYEYARD